MACIICGKTQRIIPVNIVKYKTTHNSLAEVLMAVLGSKLKEVDWSSADHQICYPCNRQCEQYDSLDLKLQDLKEQILQEYARQVYRGEQKQTPFKKIKLNVQDSQRDQQVKIAEDEEITEEADRASPITLVSDDELDPSEMFVGQHVPLKEEPDDKEAVAKECSVMVDRLPEGVAERFVRPGQERVMRLVDKSKLVRLPDYDHEQWYELDGYCLVPRLTNSRGNLLHCYQRKCPVSVRVTRSSIVRVTGQHTHEPDNRIAQRNHLIARLKERAAGEQISLRTIYTEEAARYPGGAKLLPFSAGQMREWRSADKDDTTAVVENESSATEDTQRHSCDLCNISFRFPKQLVAHLREHDEKSLRCKICHRLFTDRKKLQIHQVTHKPAAIRAGMSTSTPLKSGGKNVSGNPVDSVMKKLALKSLQRMSRNAVEKKSRKCQICDQEFSNLEELKTHTATSHEDVNLCCHCEVAFSSKQLLAAHNDEMHISPEERKKREYKKIQDELMKIEEWKRASEKSKEGDIEVKEKERRASEKIKDGMKMEETGKIDLDQIPHEMETEKRKKRVSVKIRYEMDMDENDKDFDKIAGQEESDSTADETGVDDPVDVDWEETIEAREVHAEETSGLKRQDTSVLKGVKCGYCPKWLPSKTSLVRHIALYHKQRFQCRHCSEHFPDKFACVSHEMRCSLEVAGGVDAAGSRAKYKCEVCSKGHANEERLADHMYTHCQRKKYECSHCGYSHHQRSTIIRHMGNKKNHTGTIIVNPPVLDPALCGPREPCPRRPPSDVPDHRRQRSAPRYECSVCGGRHPTTQSLYAHMKQQGHLSDSVIVLEATTAPVMHYDWRQEKMKKEVLDKPVVIDGMKIKYKKEAMLSWYRHSGKRPFECAVCGDGYMDQASVLKHMQQKDHISDSIVENIPVLEDMESYAEVPVLKRERDGARPKREIEGVNETTGEVIYADDGDVSMPEEETSIKQEPKRIEILSQVIIQPELHATDGRVQDADENQMTTYVTENEAGETVLVLQGDVAGNLNEDSQLFMDEEGNIVTQDEDGNTVQVMQVDVVQAQRMQQQAQEAMESGIHHENPEIRKEKSEIHKENLGICEEKFEIHEDNSETCAEKDAIDEQTSGTGEEIPGTNEEKSEDLSLESEENPAIGVEKSEINVGTHEESQEETGGSMPNLDAADDEVTKGD